MKAQHLLLQWITTLGAVRYARIKSACDFINERNELGLDKPAGYLFFPLLKSGVIDFCGNNRYARAPRIAWTNGERTITNDTEIGRQKTGVTGLYYSTDTVHASIFNGARILSKVPNVEIVVESFPVGIIDVSQADKTIGVVDEPNKSYTQYFIDNRKNLMVKIPTFEENPDAISWARMYENILHKHYSSYNKDSLELKIYKYGVPIILYRVLLTESLLSGRAPDENTDYLTFSGIHKRTAGEINRIQLKTLKYE